MKPERHFIAERAAAQHCRQLFGNGPDHGALNPLLGRLGDRLARRLAGALAPLLGGEAPMVSCEGVREGTLATLRDSAPRPLAANCLFAIGPAQTPLLVTIDAVAVLEIVDRAYGGKGTAPRPLPAAFPTTAELMIARLEALMATHIAGAVDAICEGNADMAGARAIAPQRRDGSLAQLAPFAEDQPLAILALEVAEGLTSPWFVTLALPVSGLPALFGLIAAPPQRRAAATRTREPGAPFGDVPLVVSARIVDMALPFATVASLAPGQVLPVTVARAVPLRVGDTTIARGTIGALDDCLAIRITAAFPH